MRSRQGRPRARAPRGNSPQDQIAEQLDQHDANIDSDLSAHDANIDSDLAAHDDAVRALHPIPISACTTIDQPGSYRVVQNLSATGDCLLVAASNVTIDLGGFTLSGDGTGDGVTTDGSKVNIAVHHGTVTGFMRGLDLSNTATVRNVRAVENENGIMVDGGGSLISGNVVAFNQDDGIVVGSGTTVTGNIAAGNGNGIEVSTGGTVGGNTAWGNSGTGLSVRCPSNVFDNTATDNGANLELINPGCNDVNNLPP